MHEIITIQIGTQSNFLGTHFWNAQESYFTYGSDQESPVNHDISFRPGIAADGSDTFTPRTLIYDLKDAFGTLKQTNALYETQDESNDPLHSLGGNPSIIRQPVVPQHLYQQNLDLDIPVQTLGSSTVRFWSDYNRVYYHPRSLLQIQPDSITSSLSSITSWEAGIDLFDTEDREHDVLDRDFRFFAEECDQMQGVVIIAGNDSAWGGFAGRYTERLRDELGKGVIWVSGVQDTIPTAETREKRLQRLGNSMKSLHSLGSSASLYSPLVSSLNQAPDYLEIDSTSPWQTSALQASWVETMSLPSRLRTSDPSNCLLSEFEQLFTAISSTRRILQPELSVDGFQSTVNGTRTNGDHHAPDDVRVRGADLRADQPDSLDITLFPPNSPSDRKALRPHLFSRALIQRGQASRAIEPASRSQDPYGPALLNLSSSLAFPLSLSSYPPIFRRSQDSATNESSLTFRASLSASSTVATWLRGMADQSRRLLSLEDREEISSVFRTWADEYVEGWESADDSGDDSD